MTVYKVLLCSVLLVLAGCQASGNKDTVKTNGFSIKQIAKGDIDMVLELQLRNSTALLKELMKKLYLRNPAYWRSRGFRQVDDAVSWAFGSQNHYAVLEHLQQAKSIHGMQLAFDETFQGDRVLAFVFGLNSMLKTAYDNKTEFFLLDDLEPQKIYNATRNIEVAVWKLSNDRDANGQLFLVSNELNGSIKNLSFERLFGKLIAIHDTSAQVVADKTNRRIKNVLQGVARFVFLPI